MYMRVININIFYRDSILAKRKSSQAPTRTSPRNKKAKVSDKSDTPVGVDLTCTDAKRQLFAESEDSQ